MLNTGFCFPFEYLSVMSFRKLARSNKSTSVLDSDMELKYLTIKFVNTFFQLLLAKDSDYYAMIQI